MQPDQVNKAATDYAGNEADLSVRVKVRSAFKEGYNLASQENEKCANLLKSACKMIEELKRRHHSVLRNLDIPNEDKCAVLNHMGVSCDSFEQH